MIIRLYNGHHSVIFEMLSHPWTRHNTAKLLSHTFIQSPKVYLQSCVNTEQPWLSSTSRTDQPYTVRGCGGSQPNSGHFRHILYLGELTIFRLTSTRWKSPIFGQFLLVEVTPLLVGFACENVPMLTMWRKWPDYGEFSQINNEAELTRIWWVLPDKLCCGSDRIMVSSPR